MTKPLISVIVPVYNVQPYISRCLDSILMQTYDNLEIIVVEDGSSDGSKQVVKDYEQKLSHRIKAIYQDHLGVSMARNNGFAISKGEYIVFVDSDDFIAREMIETMFTQMKEGVTLVETTQYFAYPDKPSIKKPYQTLRSLTQEDIQRHPNVLLEIAMTAHSKLFHRDLIAKVPFPADLIHEDVYFVQMLYPYIQAVEKSNAGGYYHFQRAGSITHTYNDRIYDMLTVQKLVAQQYQQRGFFQQYKQLLERNAIRTLVISTIGRKMGCLSNECKPARRRRYNEIKTFIHDTYPHFLNNPYLTTQEKAYALTLLASKTAAQLSWTLVPKMVRR